MTKAFLGNYFEDFRLGQELHHATPRTLTFGDVALYNALYGSRNALHTSSPFALDCGYKDSPIDDFLAFHMVFGKSVPDISLNAVANLGYAEGVFHEPLFGGDTITASSTVIGLKENSNRKTGVVYVETKGFNQDLKCVLSYKRWVMVNKKDFSASVQEHLPVLKKSLSASDLPQNMPELAEFNIVLSGSPYKFNDYNVGEKIDHIDGVTLEEAEHMMATRLYHNTAKVHFNQHAQNQSRFGRRLIYGGHIISHARALSFNGLGNGCRILGLNAGSHLNPSFAGDTIYAWSEVLEKATLNEQWGAVRVRTIATKNETCASFPENRHEAAVLSLDYWLALPQ